jgi:hypothetical protein
MPPMHSLIYMLRLITLLNILLKYNINKKKVLKFQMMLFNGSVLIGKNIYIFLRGCVNVIATNRIKQKCRTNKF